MMFALRSLLRSLPQTSSTSRPFFTPSTIQQRATFTSTTLARSQRPHSISRPQWHRLHHKQQHQQRTYRRQAFNYQRFNTTRSYFQAWRSRPTFYYEVGGVGAAGSGFYIYNLETVPVSGRKRFNIVPNATEASQGQQMYAATMQEFSGRIMSPLSREHRLVKGVLNRLIPHSGLEGEEWEVHVIDDEMKNAFVIPGGKVFVFRGILDVCNYTESGVASVLGHEIAHNVAHHAAERMSQSAILVPIAIGASLMLGVDPGIGSYMSKIAFELPGSRSQESEADYIGLLMMADACYDPEAAVELWGRMEAEEKGQAPPQFMSTHPSSHGRMERIKEWLPEARERAERSGCAGMGGFASAFRKNVVGEEKWRDVNGSGGI